MPAVAPSHDWMLLPAPHGVAGVTEGGLSVTKFVGKRSVKDKPVMAAVSLLVIVMFMVAKPVAGLKAKLFAMVGVALTIRVPDAGVALLPALVVVTPPAAMVLT